MSDDRLRIGVQTLEQRYRVQVSDHALDSTGYLAGADDVRADALNRALRDTDVRAILLSRGGYGLLRILDRLDADALRRDPKILVGYSDATALLAWALSRAGVRGIHGPMVAHFGELSGGDQQWLMDMMESTVPPGAIPERGSPSGARGHGVASGRLIGGNLCLLSHLIGTPYELATRGAVLLIEEVGERPYAIDRFLTHLYLAGGLGEVSAVVVGDLVRCEEKVWPPEPTAYDAVSERLEAFGIAGLGALPIGHGDRNRAFPFAGRCEVDFDRAELRLLEAAVS